MRPPLSRLHSENEDELGLVPRPSEVTPPAFCHDETGLTYLAGGRHQAARQGPIECRMTPDFGCQPDTNHPALRVNYTDGPLAVRVRGRLCPTHVFAPHGGNALTTNLTRGN